jgi:uncharacterized membrane protein
MRMHHNEWALSMYARSNDVVAIQDLTTLLMTILNVPAYQVSLILYKSGILTSTCPVFGISDTICDARRHK